MSAEQSVGIDRQTERLISALREPLGIITSTDLDGLLTAALVTRISDWRLVGFFDSRDTLWLSQAGGRMPSGYVYLDIYVAQSDVLSIDQHIVASDGPHALELTKSGNKINPNLARTTSFEGPRGHAFTSKYPFGTVHYLLALLERAGMAPEVMFDREIASGITVMDLFMRADGAAENTRTYAANAATWWTWLEEAGGLQTRQMAERARYIAKSDEGFNTVKTRLNGVFNAMGCKSSDANFSSPLKAQRMDTVGAIVGQFWRWLDGSGETSDFDLTRFDGRHVRVQPGSSASAGLLDRSDLFTYAYTNMRQGGFSATLLDIAAESTVRGDWRSPNT